ncbi:3-keto-5-aminohexanoate cleavage protein [Labrys sp. KB_33_2]|uniref:3-keto-5-aminohexanoate cleavage protein n=1 Tax=Labrys sp. KB_33_2 TaxID=3237479 RepID=UPI003F8DFD54
MSVTPDYTPRFIAVAPNGGRRTKADHPALPMTPSALAQTATTCLEAGAAMIHVHVRRNDGDHLLDAEAYRAVITAIGAVTGKDLVVQITSEALGLYSPAEQRAVIRATRPEAVSLALRELVPDTAEEAAFAELLLFLRLIGAMPQIILYTPDEARRLAEFQRRGLIPFEKLPVLYVLGRYTADQTSQPDDLLPFLAEGMPRFDPWSLCSFGPQEVACVTAAARRGGHARVGFENNLHRPDGTLARDNAELVVLARQAIEAAGLRIGDADALRAATLAT